MSAWLQLQPAQFVNMDLVEIVTVTNWERPSVSLTFSGGQRHERLVQAWHDAEARAVIASMQRSLAEQARARHAPAPPVPVEPPLDATARLLASVRAERTQRERDMQGACEAVDSAWLQEHLDPRVYNALRSRRLLSVAGIERERDHLDQIRNIGPIALAHIDDVMRRYHAEQPP